MLSIILPLLPLATPQPPAAITSFAVPLGTGNAHSRVSLDSISDQDADGVRDFLVGLPDLNRVQLRSGANGALLGQAFGPAGSVAFGFTVSGAQDFDNDGLADLVVSDPMGGAIYVYASTLLGAPTWTVSGAQVAALVGPGNAAGGNQFGTSLRAVPDVSGNGTPEILVGDAGWSQGAITTGAMLLLQPNLAGGTTTLLGGVFGATSGGGFGYAVEALQALPGGAGVRFFASNPFPFASPQGDVSVYSYSGGALVQVGAIPINPGPGWGASVFALGDVDGDTNPDLGLTRSDAWGGGGSCSITTYSAVTGATRTTASSCQGDPFGVTGLWNGASFNPGGTADFVLGVQDQSGTSTGHVEAYDGRSHALLFSHSMGPVSSKFGASLSELDNLSPGAQCFLVSDPPLDTVHVVTHW